MKNRPIPSANIVTEWEDNILFDADDPDFCNITAANIVVNNAQPLQTTIAAADIVMGPASLSLPLQMPTIATPGTSPALYGSLTNANKSMNSFNFKLSTTTTARMSLASVHGPQFTDICSPLGHSSISMSSSVSDLVGSPLEISVDNVVTIEELRQHMGSCFTCGVSWTDDHVSLDCSECGGYSLERPCPLCDGQCGVQWKRDFAMSHACSKARWHGVCPSYPEIAAHLNNSTAAANNVTPVSRCAAATTQLRLAQELCARLEQLSASAHT